MQVNKYIGIGALIFHEDYISHSQIPPILILTSVEVFF